MNWIDQLRMASFKGVPFQVDTVDITAGDNVVVREYPFQDLPTVFRMGEAVEEFKIAAYVIGDDYLDQVVALRLALTGEGVLIHPTAGAVRVYVSAKYTIKENPTAEGGMARFDLSFVRAEARRYPVTAANTPQQAFQAAEKASAAVQSAMAASWNLPAAPSWAQALAVLRLSTSITAVWGQISAVTGQITGFRDAVIGNYQALTAGLTQLITMPQALAQAVAGLFALPSDMSAAVARDYQAAFAWGFELSSKLVKTDYTAVVIPAAASSGHSGVGDAGLVIYGAGSADTLGLSSDARQQLAVLMASTDALFETLATAAYVQTLVFDDIDNYDRALMLRKSVYNQCTRLLMTASVATPSQAMPDSSYHDAVSGLLTAALQDVQTRSRDLARLTTYTPQSWEPVWQVSYKLFGTAAYADEILAMNPHITHPMLVQPGRALRIVMH